MIFIGNFSGNLVDKNIVYVIGRNIEFEFDTFIYKLFDKKNYIIYIFIFCEKCLVDRLLNDMIDGIG
jgi:hypothetical protein